MSKHKSSRHKAYPLEILNRLVDTPQLLAHENKQEFLQLLDSLDAYGKPKTSRDYLAVYQAAVLTWDILRYQEMKVGVLRSHQRPAFESLIRKIHVRSVEKGSESVVKKEANQLATQWFADPASRPTIMELFEIAGYPPNAIEVEAFQLALPALAPIERLIVSAQKRLDLFLKELEKTSEASAEELRLAAEMAIAAHDADVLASRK